MRTEQRPEDLMIIEVGSSQEPGLVELRWEQEPVGCPEELVHLRAGTT